MALTWHTQQLGFSLKCKPNIYIFRNWVKENCNGKHLLLFPVLDSLFCVLPAEMFQYLHSSIQTLCYSSQPLRSYHLFLPIGGNEVSCTNFQACALNINIYSLCLFPLLLIATATTAKSLKTLLPLSAA